MQYEIQHHGIKGQRWGVRRFQNDNGTLTSAGKERYGANTYNKMDERGKIKYHKDQYTIQTKNYQRAQDTGKRVVKSLLLWPWARNAYDASRAHGDSRARAAAKTLVSNSLLPIIGPVLVSSLQRSNYAQKKVQSGG